MPVCRWTPWGAWGVVLRMLLVFQSGLFRWGKWITGQSMGSAVGFAQYVRIRIRRFDIYTYHGKLCVDCSSEMFA